MYRDRKTRSVVYLLEQASRFNRLAKTCPPQCSEGFYRLKDNALKKALNIAPEQFIEDSRIIARGIIGMTHIPSNRKFHLHITLLKSGKKDMHHE